MFHIYATGYAATLVAHPLIDGENFLADRIGSRQQLSSHLFFPGAAEISCIIGKGYGGCRAAAGIAHGGSHAAYVLEYFPAVQRITALTHGGDFGSETADGGNRL